MTDRALWRFDAIGTTWEIETAEPLDGVVRQSVASVIEDFDASWSRFREDSLVSALARRGGRVPAPRDATAMLALYAELSTATGGAVNPLVGESLARRGYDASISLVDHGPVGAPAGWEAIVELRDAELSVREPVLVDVGALGKGRLVDLVLAVVAVHAQGTVVVDASGDLAVRGAPQRIGLEHPYDPSRAVGVWEVADAALCASATNRRAWGDGLHHVLDARTGQPVRTIAATWAVADTAMHADAIATALFFDGGPRLAHAWGAPWVRMTTDGRLEWSPECTAELFVAGSVGA